eukprot:2741878-Pyramimonas_sp.AAC.1
MQRALAVTRRMHHMTHADIVIESVAIWAQTMAASASRRRKADEALVELQRGSYLSQRALA